jgi:hypothetical protein
MSLFTMLEHCMPALLFGSFPRLGSVRSAVQIRLPRLLRPQLSEHVVSGPHRRPHGYQNLQAMQSPDPLPQGLYHGVKLCLQTVARQSGYYHFLSNAQHSAHPLQGDTASIECVFDLL